MRRQQLLIACWLVWASGGLALGQLAPASDELSVSLFLPVHLKPARIRQISQFRRAESGGYREHRVAAIVKRGAGDHTTGMSTLLEIESAINELSLAELAELERLVRDELRERRNVKTADATALPRVLGLHEGAWSVADDFDAPLPEDLWLGTDA